MILVEEALNKILFHIQSLGFEKVSLLESLGRVAGEDVHARRDIPPLDNSGMDGYAVRAIDIRKASFWHQSFEPRPPKLDGDGYSAYKSLPPQSLIIFDTMRAAHDLDENDSKDMAQIMGRLKEIRNAGFTVLVIHHAGKGNDRASKGSTAITDLADHVLSLYRVRRNTFKEIDDDNEASPDDLFRLGTGEKTRYEPFQLFLKRSETGAFVLADDPDEEAMQAISDFVRAAGHALNQTEIFTWAKKDLEMGRKTKLVRLLRKGENRLWISIKTGVKRTYVST